MLEPKDLQPGSWAIFGGRDHRSGATLDVPLIRASNFIAGGKRAYSRDDGTPTWEALEHLVGGLEGGSAVAFASGMAATAALFDPLPVGSPASLLGDSCGHGPAAGATTVRPPRQMEAEFVRSSGGVVRFRWKTCALAD